MDSMEDREATGTDNMLAWYIMRVNQAREAYDEAMKDNDGTKDEFDIDVTKLKECHDICRDLLARPDLPYEHRATLNYYMAFGIDDMDLALSYIDQGIAALDALDERRPGHGDEFKKILNICKKIIQEHGR